MSNTGETLPGATPPESNQVDVMIPGIGPPQGHKAGSAKFEMRNGDHFRWACRQNIASARTSIRHDISRHMPISRNRPTMAGLQHRHIDLAMRERTHTEIRLWCTFCSDIADPELLESYRTLMSRAELAQQSRFHLPRDRHRYLLTRALVRTVIATLTGIAPNELAFTANKYGRPELSNRRLAANRISFNISHTHDLIVLVTARTGALGVDVEGASNRLAPIDVAENFFAPEEIAALQHLPKADQQRRFFEYWTLKESYIKARSMGLSIPLDRFSFHLSESDIEISIQPDQDDDPSRWQFWQLELAPDHLVAVCAERFEGKTAELSACRIVPLSSEQTLPFVVLRTTPQEPGR
jgi:4'-phosphopantetheinyl transferase